ncbi:MAG: sulfotransferase [Candidatus Neomarinimicrobiota bacterium]
MSEKDRITKRIFIVGAARSGTTLVQSLFASHPDLCSFPETHFFRATVPKISWMRPLKKYGSGERRIMGELLNRAGDGSLLHLLPQSTWSTERWSAAIIRILDEHCLKRDYSAWVEKTPMHLYYIHLISSVSPDSRFIHVIRNGQDVVASLYEASHKHPEYFGGARSVNRCIRRWKHDVSISRRFVDSDNHVHVMYENIVVDPERELKHICDAIGIAFSKKMLSYETEAATLRLPEETWKVRNSEPIRKTRKFETLFSQERQDYILRKMRNIDLKAFQLQNSTPQKRE